MIRPSMDCVRRMFLIDAQSGRVTWRDPPANHPRLLNREAGNLRRTQSGKLYCVIHINRQSIKRGHLIFFSVHGRWPLPCLDHIDGDSTNDCISNLREATTTQNAWNHKRRTKKSPLPMGVRVTQSGRFHARIAAHKKTLSIGTFDTPEEASMAYQAKRLELYGSFA